MLAECVSAALRREWDPQQIRGHVARRSWDEVARQVLSQWLLARDCFGAKASHPDLERAAARPDRIPQS